MFKLENSQNYSEKAYLTELRFIQNCIDNMRDNSRNMKTYAILIAFAGFFSGMVFRPFIASIIATGLVILLILDCYYLRLERAYRKMYNDVRVKRLSDESNYTMDSFDLNPSVYLKDVDPIHKIALSITELPFYGIWILYLIVFIVGAWI